MLGRALDPSGAGADIGTTMGWRDRDYAKWTDEERRRFYGSSSSAGYDHDWPRVSPTRRGGVLRPGAALAVLATVCIALGQLPLNHPLVPAFHFTLRGSGGTSPAPILTPSAPIAPITGPSTAAVGTRLVLHGSAPEGNGVVTVEGSYDGGQTWLPLASVSSTNGSYAATITLTQRGVLQLRILTANGTSAVGSITVQ
jgi:hypothetical protein